MLIYVLRHGITQWNKLKKVQGAMDIPLAPEGIELAKRTGEALKDVPFDICFTSPLARARQTAHYVLGNRQIPVIEDKRIQEIDFGVLEGSRFKDEQGKIISHEMEIFFEEPQKFERPQNGENISDILKRTREFWVEKTTDPALADKTILVSSHGCAVRALLQNVYQDPEHFWHGCVPPNCSINLLEVKDGKARFLEEARTMAKMEKQQVIVGVRDFFETNNTAYIVMEYIEGTTFTELVAQRGGRIPPEELFALIEPLFNALANLHRLGLIHRDISPDNLMLEDGEVRLIDFGCARDIERGNETLTITLKHGYAPIEQYQTSGGQGPWTDVYALCATIYFCLVGQKPPQALNRIGSEKSLILPSKLGIDISQ